MKYNDGWIAQRRSARITFVMSLVKTQASSKNLCRVSRYTTNNLLLFGWLYINSYVKYCVGLELLILNSMWIITPDYAFFCCLFQSEYRTCQTRHNGYYFLSNSLPCDWKTDLLVFFFAQGLLYVPMIFMRIIYWLALLWPSQRSPQR